MGIRGLGNPPPSCYYFLTVSIIITGFKREQITGVMKWFFVIKLRHERKTMTVSTKNLEYVAINA